PIPRPEHRTAPLTPADRAADPADRAAGPGRSRRPTRPAARLVEQVGDGSDARLDGALADLAETKHELRGSGCLGCPEIAHPEQADSPLARGRPHPLLVRGGRPGPHG